MHDPEGLAYPSDVDDNDDGGGGLETTPNYQRGKCVFGDPANR